MLSARADFALLVFLAVLSCAESQIVSFQTTNYTVDKRAGIARVDIVRVISSPGVTTVEVFTEPDTALEARDYDPLAATVTFQGDQTQLSIEIPIIANPWRNPGPPLQFRVRLRNPVGGQLGNAVTVVSIIDSDSVGVSSVIRWDSQFYSVEETSGFIRLAVRRSGIPDTAASVQYRTGSETATAGKNFIANEGRLNWEVGDTTERPVNISILRDDIPGSPPLTFNVTLFNVQGAGLIDPTTATVTINDIDAATLVLTFENQSINVDETIGIATIKVQRQGNSPGTVSVNYETRDGTARAGSDYLPSFGTLTFPFGTTQLEIPVQIMTDFVPNSPTKFFEVILTSPSAGSLGTSTLLVNIMNRDPSYYYFQPLDYHVQAGDVAQITIQRMGNTREEGGVSIVTSDDTARATVDYTAISATVTFAPDEIVKSAAVSTLRNIQSNAQRSFFVKLVRPVNGFVLARENQIEDAVVTIVPRDGSTNGTSTNDDTITSPTPVSAESGQVTFAVDTLVVSADQTQAVARLRRVRGRTGNAVVSYTTQDGSARAGVDYSSVSGSFSWLGGDDTDRLINVPILRSAVNAQSYFFIMLDEFSGVGRGDITTVAVWLQPPIRGESSDWMPGAINRTFSDDLSSSLTNLTDTSLPSLNSTTTTASASTPIVPSTPTSFPSSPSLSPLEPNRTSGQDRSPSGSSARPVRPDLSGSPTRQSPAREITSSRGNTTNQNTTAPNTGRGTGGTNTSANTNTRGPQRPQLPDVASSGSGSGTDMPYWGWIIVGVGGGGIILLLSVLAYFWKLRVKNDPHDPHGGQGGSAPQQSGPHPPAQSSPPPTQVNDRGVQDIVDGGVNDPSIPVNEPKFDTEESKDGPRIN